LDRLVLSLLGGFRARLESGAHVPVPTKKAQALLAYLATSRTEGHMRDTLATLLWGESTQECARHCLRQTLFVLRSTLEPLTSSVLRCDRSSVSLDRSRLCVDVDEFERFALQECAESLERAGELYRGDFLTGIGAHDQAFEDWLRDERDRLAELAVEVHKKLLVHYRTSGMAEQAIRNARRLLALDPLQEVVHRALIHLYLAQGRPRAARRQYEACVRILARELGTEPEAETSQLLGRPGG
jgi:DNA-binding SARP family transcriptional activator